LEWRGDGEPVSLVVKQYKQLHGLALPVSWKDGVEVTVNFLQCNNLPDVGSAHARHPPGGTASILLDPAPAGSTL
jgi:hypothetical protein